MTGSVRLRPSGSCDHHRAGLAVGGRAHHHRHQQLAGLALEHLLDRAAVERLAVAGALDPPGGGGRLSGACAGAACSRRDQHGARRNGGRQRHTLARG